MEKKHCVVASDAGPDALCKAADVIGEGSDPEVFVWTRGECRVLEGHAGVLVNDGIGKGIMVDDVSGSGDVPSLHRFCTCGIGTGAKGVVDRIIVVG